MKIAIRNYLIDALMSDESTIEFNTKLLGNGLLDSMGLLFLIEFLNENFKVEVNDDELIPENFETIQSIVSFVERKI